MALAAGAALGLIAGSAAAKPSLRDAIRAEDRSRIAAKPAPEPTDKSPKIEIGSDEPGGGGTGAKSIRQGEVKVELSFKDFTRGADTLRAPIVTVSVRGKEVARIEQNQEDVFSAPYLSLQITELDAANATPEIVVSFFTGGAHCCSDTKVLTAEGDNWRTVELGQFDGGPLLATDLDGDARYEFATRDNAFLYAFGCYACSAAPLKIIQVEGAKARAVSGEPRYRPAQESWLRDLITSVDKDTEPNAFLAGYVAQKVLLGEGPRAWKLMLAHYDMKADDGLEQCPETVNPDGECPVKPKKYKFPEALKKLLSESGYAFEP